MEIMEWVRKRVKNKNLGYWLALVFLSLLAAYLAFGKIFASINLSPKEPTETAFDHHLLWHFPWAATLIGIIYLWIYYAPVVCADLERLKNAFPRDEGYLNLYNRFQGWLRQFYRDEDRKIYFFKIIYTILWMLDLICFMFCFCDIYHQNFTDNVVFLRSRILVFFTLSIITIILNYSSYYICTVFVYFLNQLCKLDKDLHLNYQKARPSATYGFQLLDHSANMISLFFLLDSSLCEVGLYSFWRVISIGNITMTVPLLIAVIYVTFFFIIFGWTSWGFIILFSRAYLYRLHSEWKFRSFEEFTEKNCIDTEYSTANHVIEQLAMDKITVGPLNLLISIAALAANVVTAWSLLNS